MNNILEYKGYKGSVEYSAKDEVLFGQVLGIRSLISYEGKSVDELKQDFEGAVDDYLVMCEEEGVEPEKYYKGSISIRLDPELHREAAVFAQSEHMTLNQFITSCIRDKVRPSH